VADDDIATSERRSAPDLRRRRPEIRQIWRDVEDDPDLRVATVEQRSQDFTESSA
jgi:hypothetical protein